MEMSELENAYYTSIKELKEGDIVIVTEGKEKFIRIFSYYESGEYYWEVRII